MRRAARIDATASDLVKHAKRLGAEYVPVNGVIDGLIWYRGTWHVIDWKSPNGELTPAQAKLVARGCLIRFISSRGQLEDLLLAKDAR